MELGRVLRAVETLVNIGQAFTHGRRDGVGNVQQREPDLQADIRDLEAPRPDLTAGNRLFGQLEARLAGVLVSALKEAFDRDRAHLEMEREQIDQERKRAQELMRLELLRQAGERELAGIRWSILVSLAVWITSVMFMMVQRAALGAAGIILLAVGWTLLLGALGVSFAGYRHVAGLLARGAQEPLDAAGVARHPLAPAVPWLIVLGLGCTAASLLVRLAA